MYSGLTENLHIWRCYVFRNRSSAEKLEVVQKNNHCLNCPLEGHSVKPCTGELVYRLSDCNAKYSNDLHTGLNSRIFV